MFEEVLDSLTAFLWVFQDAGLTSYVGLELGFQHVAQLCGRAEPCLVMAGVEVVGFLHDKPHCLGDWMSQGALLPTALPDLSTWSAEASAILILILLASGPSPAGLSDLDRLGFPAAGSPAAGSQL